MAAETLSRRDLLQRTLSCALTYAALRLTVSARLLAEPLAAELDGWVRSLDARCRDLQLSRLSAASWQAEIEALLERVSLDELLAAIDFARLESRLRYPDLGVDTAAVRFPGFAPHPAGLAFHAKLFGMERDRAIVPHGHRNMVSAHLVLGGRFHLRQYERVTDEPGALIVRPTVDEHVGPGHASSISDERNNVHWLIARGGRAYTLDVIVLGLDDRGPEFEIDNLDAERAEPVTGGALRMPRITVAEALERYGRDHHAVAEPAGTDPGIG